MIINLIFFSLLQIDMLCKLVAATEKTMSMEPGSALREPLMKALARFPPLTIEYFISDTQCKEPKSARFMAFMINHSSEEGIKIREALKMNIDRLTNLLDSAHTQSRAEENKGNATLAEIQFSCVRLGNELNACLYLLWNIQI